MNKKAQEHQKGSSVTDLQFAPDRTYFITASKDKTARIWDASNLDLLKTYVSDTPLNTAAITPVKDFVHPKTAFRLTLRLSLVEVKKLAMSLPLKLVKENSKLVSIIRFSRMRLVVSEDILDL